MVKHNEVNAQSNTYHNKLLDTGTMYNDTNKS